MGYPSRIRIREVGLREGAQSMPVVATADKLSLIEALSLTGIRDIELTSFVRADKVPQMADADEVVSRFARHPGVRYTALYLNQKGFERGEATGRLDNEAWLYSAASDEFLRRNANVTARELEAQIPSWIDSFNRLGKPLRGLMLSTAFGCPFEGAIAVGRVLETIRGVCNAAGTSCIPEICLADTIGVANPVSVKRLVGDVREAFPQSEVSLHLHDTRGLGIANAMAGLELGVTTFDASVGGLGGCPFAKGAAGNIATEDLVYLCTEIGVDTGVDLGKYVEAARMVASVFGAELPGRVHKVPGFP